MSTVLFQGYVYEEAYDVTCDPVSIEFVLAPVVVFQKWMCRS